MITGASFIWKPPTGDGQARELLLGRGLPVDDECARRVVVAEVRGDPRGLQHLLDLLDLDRASPGRGSGSSGDSR